jgi:hypothetical protein
MPRKKLFVLYLVTLIAVVLAVESVSSIFSIAKEIKAGIVGLYVFGAGIAVRYQLKSKEKDTKDEKNAK